MDLRNVADEAAYAQTVRELSQMLQSWVEQAGDFPPAYRVRADNTGGITGVQFIPKIPPLQNLDAPPPVERWGRPGPS